MYITADASLAEDVLQDAFERALRSLGSFDNQRPFAPWLHRIVVNRARDLMMRHPRDVPLLEETVGGANPHVVAEDMSELLQALGDLDLERRVVIVLRLLFGYTPAEVAVMLEIEVGTVHSRLSRALTELRQRLEVPDEA